LVVGGGAIGLGIAWRLAQRGAAVTVIDRGPMAGEASSHAAGMLVPLAEAEGPGPFLDLCLASRDLYPSFAKELLERTGLGLEHAQNGLLEVAIDEAEEPALATRLAWLRTLSFGVERLDAQALRAREPAISPGAVGGFFLPSEGWVSTPKLAHALTRAAHEAGVRLLPEHRLMVVERQGSRVTAVRAGVERILAGRFVIAAGPWSAEVGEQFGLRLPVFPVRGQLIALDGEPSPIHHVIYGHGIYLVRWLSGDLIVGSTVEHVGFVKEVTAEGIAGLLAAAIELVPGLAARAIRRVWACLRPGTPDELPILGRAQEHDNVFVATGHYRNGILLTPITGHLMADLILDKPPQVDLRPFRPDRASLLQSSPVS
jgi:glycine oxidase